MSRRGAENLQRQAEHTRPRRRISVVGYLMILFAVAFLLLLMAYFQQQRTNAETTDALKQSASAVESIQQLISDNERLRQQVEQLEKERDSTVQARDQAQNQLGQAQRSLEAMQWFWQIDDYYVHGSYRKARELINQFEEQGLKEALPAENTTGTECYSPAGRYQEIYDALY